MTFIVSDSEGIEVLSVLTDPSEGFVPRLGTGTTLDPSFFWRALPSDYDDLKSSDKKQIEAIWSSMMQYFSAVLAETAHLDQAVGLVDHPVRLPRKWIHYELERYVDLSVLTDSLKNNLPGDVGGRLLKGGDTVNRTYLEMTQGGRHRGAYIELGGPHIEAATVRAELRLAFRDPVPRAVPLDVEALPVLSSSTEIWLLAGYGDLSKERQAPGVYLALSTQGRVGIMSRKVDGEQEWTIAADTIASVRSGGELVLQLWYEGQTATQPGYATARVSAKGEEVVVSAEVEGPFKAKHFALLTPDTRVPVAADVVTLLSSGSGRSFSVLLDTLTYLDVSCDARTRYIPTLQPRVSDEEGVLVQGIEYDIYAVDTNLEKWAAIHFVEQPESILWADSVGLDARLLEKTFGKLLGTTLTSKSPDSEKFKNRIFGMLYGLLAGPHTTPLAVALSAIGGVPVAMRPGTVIAVEGPRGEPAIVVQEYDHERVYPYPPLLRPTVSLGDVVLPFQLLTEGVEVFDWTSGGRQFLQALQDQGIISHEVEKFSAFLVEVPYGVDGGFSEDAGDYSFPSKTREFLQRIQAIWVGVFRTFFRMVARLSDVALVGDSVSWEGLLTLRDSVTNARDPRYNDGRGFLYDASGLVYNEADVEILRERLLVQAYNNPGFSVGAVLATLFDATVNIPLGSTVEAAEYESLPTTPWA